MSAIVSRFMRKKSSLNAFVADDSPNTTPPAAGEILDLNDRVPGVASEPGTRGHLMWPVFKDAGGAEVIGPTCDFVTWFKDEAATNGGWVATKKQTLAPHRNAFALDGLQNCKVWTQVTAVASLGAAVSVSFQVAEKPGF